MEKEPGDAEKGTSDAASLLDAANLFGGGHSLFGGIPGGLGPHLSPHLPFTMLGGRAGSYHPATNTPAPTPPPTAPGPYGSLGTLSVAASQAASLGINPAASAAWWTMASHLAAQDYLARLQASAAAGGISFGGLPGTESLVPSYPLLSAPHSQAHVPSSKSGGGKNTSSKTTATVAPTLSTTSSTGHGGHQRERERERDRERERERDRATTPVVHPSPGVVSDPTSILGGVRLPPDTEIIKYTSSIVGPKIPGTTNRGRKKTISLDPPSLSVMPTPLGPGLMVDRGNVGGGAGPGRPRRPGTNRIMDAADYRDGVASGAPPERDRDRERERDRDHDRVEVIKLPAHSGGGGGGGGSNGTVPLNIPSYGSGSYSSPAQENDAPLNLSLKPQSCGSSGVSVITTTTTTPVGDNTVAVGGSSSPGGHRSSLSSLSSLSASLGATPTHAERISRRKPGPKPRRVVQSPAPAVPTSPSPSLKQLFAAADSPRPSSGSEENDTPHKDGRPRNLGRGVSKPKKNTVASLLAQSRALGIKPTSSPEILPHNHQVSLLKSNVLAISPTVIKDPEGTEEDEMAPMSAEESEQAPTVMTTSTPNSEDSKPENNKHKRHLVSSRSEDNKLKIRAVEGMSEDSSAPDVSSDSGSNSEGFPSDSEGEGSEAGSKREGDGMTGPSAKRRKMEVELHQLRVPLELGWRRETVLGTLSRAGLLRGEVSYISPCGRRFRQCQDVMRFIEKNDVSELSRDNFSFSCRVLVGEFLQPVPGTDEMRQLSEDQVNKKLQELRQVHSHRSRANTPANAQRIEAARLAQEQKLAQQLEREKAAQAAKEAKRLAKEEAARQKEHVRLLKEKERCERQETIRREREQRNLQMMEERELKRQQAVMIKEQAVQLYMQELSKQREMLYTVELERERRRQHMLLVKALEARKRQEERERKRQEVRAEKMASKERKLEQRRMELELVRELRKPAEDMELTDHRPLPTLNRIPGLKLSGQAFADTLMVFEFLHNFGETLGFDMDSLPSLNSLQMALLNDEEAEEELLSVMTHLLVCAIEDPGIPNPARHTTILGQSLKQADITHANLSEILRIYLYANATGEVKALTGLHFERDRDKKSDHHNVYGEPLPPCGKNAAFFEHLHDNETWKMSEWLHERPFLALNPTHKAAILAFLCNELLQNKAVIRQIDNSIETVGQLRKDRWLLDTKIRKLRMLHGRKIRQSVPHFTSKHDNNGCDESNDTGVGDVKVKEGDDADDDADEEPEDAESGNESDGTQPEEEEDKNLSVEELNRKMERLSRQSENSLQALSTSAQQLRATCFGQDRFFRRYWSLPCAGGIFVEAMESAEPELYEKCLEKLEETQDQTQDTHNQKEGAEEEKHFEIAQTSDNDHHKIRTREKVERVNDKINDREDVAITENCKKIKVENIPDTEDLSKDCSEKLSGTGFKSDGTIVNRFVLEGAVKTESVTNNRFGVKEEEDIKQEPNEGGLVSVKVDLKHNRFSSEMNKLNESKFEEAKKDNIKFSGKMQIEDGEDKSEASFLVQGPIQFEHLGECMEKANRDSAPVIVPNGDKFNALNHLYSLNSSNVFNNGKDLNGSFLLGGSAGSLLSERTWFSILPRDACDVTSITNSSNLTRCTESSAELRIPVFPPPSRLSSPSPGGSQCESPAPLVLTAEEMIQLEHLKKMLPLEPMQAKPVPKELQRGWWRITDKDQLQTILDNLHSRGVRERELKRVAGKYLEHALESCSKVCVAGGEKAVTDLAITDMDHKVAALPGGAPLRDEPNQWFPRVALRVDLQMLEQVEVLEDKVANASMQVKGWKVPGRITSDEGARFRPSCMPADLAEKTLNPVDLAKERLVSLEAAIERRYLKPPLGVSSGDVNLSGISGEVAATEDNIPKGLAVWREAVGRAHTSAQIAMALYMLEASIAWDKSIMKANCQFCHSGDNEDKLLLCDGCDKGYHTYCFKPKMENIPDGDWYCFECLNKATGERNCIVCGKKTGKNLVLCDVCPRAYHTDCLHPPLSKIPRGKWLCPTCQAKQPKKRNSSRRSGGHPKPRDSESSEHVPTSPATPSVAVDDAMSLAPNSSPPQVTPITPVGQSKKERASTNSSNKKLNKDLNPCRAVLEELEAHDEAWPFLLPVNTKQFPTYRKIIKNPMDLSTIKRKLQDSVYKSREDFCSDVRLIFNNCETFNEDDSPVGKAGHNMRSFFETRWSELNGNHQKPSTPQ